MSGEAVIWRVATHTEEYSADSLSGNGARIMGGRWNRKGRAVVYAANSVSLAILEHLVHVRGRLGVRNVFLVKIIVPPAIWTMREKLEVAALDVTWVAEPVAMTTRNLGEAWLNAARTPLLMVPSVIVPEEFNVLINPAHAAAPMIRASVRRQIIYDPRL